MKKKRVISMLLVLAMAISMLAGCGDKKNTDTTEPSSQNGENNSTADNSKPLSFKVMTVNFGEVPTGTQVNEAWLAEMEKLMGRKLDISFEYVSMGDYTEKLKIMLASGELPDLVTTWGLTQEDIFSYGENGTFVDLTSNMDKLPLYKEYLEAAPDSASKLYSSAGKLYGFYSVQTGWTDYSGGSNEIAYGTAVRKDILDKNGLEVPTTVDELYNVGKKLKEVYPDKYPFYGQTCMETLAASNHFTCNFNSTTFDGRFYDGSKFVYSPLSDAYKEVLMEVNKWYKEGLISPDFLTVNEFDSVVAAGDGMIFPSAWYGYPGYWNIDYPDQNWVFVAGIENPKYGKPWVYTQGSFDDTRILPNWCVLVNNKSKNVDELLKFMDFQLSDSVKDLFNWGIKDVTYTDTDGVKHYTEEIKTDVTTAFNKYGFGTGTTRSGIFPQIQEMNTEASIFQDFYSNGQIINNTVPGFIKDNFNFDQTITGTTLISDPLTTDEAEEYASIMTPVNTYAAEQMAAFISGSRSFEEWDKYVSEVSAMGDIQRAMDIYNNKVIGTKRTN